MAITKLLLPFAKVSDKLRRHNFLWGDLCGLPIREHGKSNTLCYSAMKKKLNKVTFLKNIERNIVDQQYAESKVPAGNHTKFPNELFIYVLKTYEFFNKS